MIVNHKRSNNVFLFPIHQSAFQDLLIVAKMMQVDVRFHPIMLLPHSDLELHIAQSDEKASGIEIERLYDFDSRISISEGTGDTSGKRQQNEKMNFLLSVFKRIPMVSELIEFARTMKYGVFLRLLCRLGLEFSTILEYCQAPAPENHRHKWIHRRYGIR